MRVIKDVSLEIQGTNTHYFRLDELSEDDGENVLLYGYNHLLRNNHFNTIKDYKRKIYLNVTMPTEFCSNQNMNLDDKFDEIYGICPYTNKWLNEVKGVDKYKTICYPFNEIDIPKNTDKKYDVCYHGGIHGETYTQCLEIMSDFNYRYMSMTNGINALTRQAIGQYATNLDLSNEEKINLISECKISICYNTFTIRGAQDINNIKSRKDWSKNEAFKHIDDLKIAPQFKSRFIEAAYCKTLNLVQLDPWNVIEVYFEPNIHYITFKDNSELEAKLKHILAHWDDYKPMIDAAYDKVLDYSTEKLYNRIKDGNK